MFGPNPVDRTHRARIEHVLTLKYRQPSARVEPFGSIRLAPYSSEKKNRVNASSYGSNAQMNTRLYSNLGRSLYFLFLAEKTHCFGLEVVMKGK